jgi:SPP1 gp7 family putative phage head morphogenesis protein
MQIRNETEIQLMKILYKTQKKKPTKNLTSKRAYPFGIENELYRKLKGFFKPLTDYVNKYLDENLESLLRGDSTEIRLDTIPGDSFRNMIYSLENWLSVYMPDISDLPEDSNNNVILTSLGKTADEAKKFGDKEFTRIIEKGIHVTPPISSPWWEDMKNSWAEDNYTLITSNAKKYVSQINTLTEQAIVNGLSPAKLKEQIKKATEGLSDKHCKLLARDQMGKLNGQITEAQMQEVGLDLYVWSTAYDDRVRDSHALMEGLLCRWDDASVCSYDNGKTWVARPSGAVDLHPGQDIQCRCVPLAFYPELEAEMTGTTLNEQTEDLPNVQNLPEFNNELTLPKYIKDNLNELKKEFNFEGNKNSDVFEFLTNLLNTDGINPHYQDSIKKIKGYPKYKYTENCQRCVPALQMKLKGFNVEALPLPTKHGIGYNDLMYGNNWSTWLKDKNGNPVKPLNVFSDIMKSPEVIDESSLKTSLINYVKQFPRGTMFELQCYWKRGGGHVFAGFTGKEGIIVYDPQSNISGKVLDHYIKNMKLDSLNIIRTDDKILDLERIKESCKNK